MFDPTKVRVVGGWPAHLDDKDRIKMRVGDEKKLLFDVAEAGPGKLSAEVRGPSGLIPVRVEMTSKDRVKVSFTPVAEGKPEKKTVKDRAGSCLSRHFTLVF